MGALDEIEPVRDIEAVWPQLRALFLALHEMHRPFGVAQLIPEWESRWRQRLEERSDDRLLLIARIGDAVVGFADVEIRRRPSVFDEEIAYINDMYGLEAERGRGIGRRLLQCIEAWSASRGVSEMGLTVMAGNFGAMTAYEQWGFRPRASRMSKRIDDASN
jgi:GNAT superfamily N-acetyltransferase